MLDEREPYWKLKPILPTPADELCVCEERPAIILCWVISDNPIRCVNCNNEVTPERLELPVESVEDIASWAQIYGSFYNLWLDSQEYEDFARAELSNPRSPVNERGYLLREKLSAVAPCYYWWFQDASEESFEPLENCPRCGLRLTENFGRLVCEKCKILVAN